MGLENETESIVAVDGSTTYLLERQFLMPGWPVAISLTPAVVVISQPEAVPRVFSTRFGAAWRTTREACPDNDDRIEWGNVNRVSDRKGFADAADQSL
ncbi:MAG: hypothetical protein CMJ59_25855 [Planctomycetaceae bacterium]|nr:hypothetical protein [Planctomycetaceae bacterium]